MLNFPTSFHDQTASSSQSGPSCDERVPLAAAGGPPRDEVDVPVVWRLHDYGNEERLQANLLIMDGMKHGNPRLELHRLSLNALPAFRLWPELSVLDLGFNRLKSVELSIPPWPQSIELLLDANPGMPHGGRARVVFDPGRPPEVLDERHQPWPFPIGLGVDPWGSPRVTISMAAPAIAPVMEHPPYRPFPVIATATASTGVQVSHPARAELGVAMAPVVPIMSPMGPPRTTAMPVPRRQSMRLEELRSLAVEVARRRGESKESFARRLLLSVWDQRCSVTARQVELVTKLSEDDAKSLVHTRRCRGALNVLRKFPAMEGESDAAHLERLRRLDPRCYWGLLAFFPSLRGRFLAPDSPPSTHEH
ncbi:hypothetical protein [Roseateles amylovorans]|uniref:Leucine-rich repeat domain-containing protein n=1 Tax=Roseateles amylovorans TaxID=2978473 RepID=A0ABY6B0Z1_9BURK|nr:hypothetical protein [Roseateles amylovorans]UXH78867.1 hypothetical protein N4261_02690 [Roseateles amylovorans]